MTDKTESTASPTSCSTCGATDRSKESVCSNAFHGPALPSSDDISLLNIAVDLVRDEVQRATRKFPTWPTDPLHALGVVAEEFGELSKAVVQQTYEPHKNAPDELRKEAIHCAAMALRFVMSLDAYEVKPCDQHSQE